MITELIFVSSLVYSISSFVSLVHLQFVIASLRFPFSLFPFALAVCSNLLLVFVLCSVGVQCGLGGLAFH